MRHPVGHIGWQKRAFTMEENGKDGDFHLTIIHVLCRILVQQDSQ